MECRHCCVAEGADLTQPTQRGRPAAQPPASQPAHDLSFRWMCVTLQQQRSGRRGAALLELVWNCDAHTARVPTPSLPALRQKPNSANELPSPVLGSGGLFAAKASASKLGPQSPRAYVFAHFTTSLLKY